MYNGVKQKTQTENIDRHDRTSANSTNFTRFVSRAGRTSIISVLLSIYKQIPTYNLHYQLLQNILYNKISGQIGCHK